MIDESTREKLRKMKLSEMIEAYDDSEMTIKDLNMTFDERFRYLVDDTFQRRHNKTVAHLIKSAHLRYPSDISNIIYNDERNLKKEMVNELATCDFIRANKAIIIKGPSSSGKTWLSCALGKQACKLAYSTQYIRVPDLFEKAKQLGVRKTINKFSKYQLLILDEWLLYPLSDDQAALILEIVERRHDSKSTIYSTIYDQSEWYERLGESARADSIMERIVHNKISIQLGSYNMRKDQ